MSERTIEAFRALEAKRTPGEMSVGRTLDTPVTRKWSAEERRINDACEAVRVLVVS